MTDHIKPGMPKDKESIQKPAPHQNPNDKFNKDKADKLRQDNSKDSEPTRNKE